MRRMRDLRWWASQQALLRRIRWWVLRRASIRAARVVVPTFKDPSLAYVPPGHFYSPIPGMTDRRAALAALERYPRFLPGINLNAEGQIELLESLRHWYNDLPFSDKADGRLRYHFQNSYYGYADGIIYACLLQELRPKKVIEVG